MQSQYIEISHNGINEFIKFDIHSPVVTHIDTDEINLSVYKIREIEVYSRERIIVNTYDCESHHYRIGIDDFLALFTKTDRRFLQDAYEGWFCPSCNTPVDAEDVTYEETHNDCGTPCKYVQKISLTSLERDFNAFVTTPDKKDTDDNYVDIYREIYIDPEGSKWSTNNIHIVESPIAMENRKKFFEQWE